MKCLFKLSWECLDVKALGKMGLKHEQAQINSTSVQD